MRRIKLHFANQGAPRKRGQRVVYAVVNATTTTSKGSRSDHVANE